MNGYSPLEHIARMMGNVVRYDEKGNPSIFVRFEKILSSRFDSKLTNRPNSGNWFPHPAFMINGEEQDHILLGKFKSAELEENGTLYALPNMPPRVEAGHTAFLERMRAFGSGAGGLTIADHGLIVLIAHKNGWTTRGNNDQLYDYRDIARWGETANYNAGDRCAYKGGIYECTASNSFFWCFPDTCPAFWKRVGSAGGTPVNPDSNPTGYVGNQTLNGTGPAEWYLGGDMAGICDVQGNVYEAVYGVRLVDGEIQIIGDNNNAADEHADLSDTGAWKAIKPGSTALGYTLVAPGTEGTVRYTFQNDKITLDTAAVTQTNKVQSCAFKDIAVNTTNIPTMPQILYELGLAPLPGTGVDGHFSFWDNKGTLFACRGGYYGSGEKAGVACLTFDYDYNCDGAECGARMRMMA